MADGDDDELRERLLKLSGKIDAYTTAAEILGAEAEAVGQLAEMARSGSVADDREADRQLAEAAMNAFNASLMRLQLHAAEAVKEFDEIKATKFPGQSFQRH